MMAVLSIFPMATLRAEVPDMEESVRMTNIMEMIADTNASIDTVWMLLAAMLVFFMQPGFALVEAGFTRTKNTTNILMKNCIDFMFGSILFWFIGLGLMFGIGKFVGTPHFFDLEIMDEIIANATTRRRCSAARTRASGR